MMSKKELLGDFIFWLMNKEDVFYAFDDPEKAIDEYFAQKND